MQLLVRVVPTFGNTTAMQLAVEAKNMEFVAHPASQDVLTKIWMGQLVEDNNPLAVKQITLTNCLRVI
jgi:transient receptor potential cation channel subfamily M protein 2